LLLSVLGRMIPVWLLLMMMMTALTIMMMMKGKEEFDLVLSM